MQHPGHRSDGMGRIHVQADLSLAERPEIFVIGDQAHVELSEGESCPPLAPAALQMGRAAAKNVELVELWSAELALPILVF